MNTLLKDSLLKRVLEENHITSKMDTSTHKPGSQFACISFIYINKASCASPSLVLLEKYSSLPFINILLYNVVSIDGSHCKFQKVSSRDTVQTRFEGAHQAH